MAGEANTDRINRLERENAALIERVDKLNADVERLRDDLKELRSKQWDVWKIVLTAVIAAAVGILMRGLPGR